MIKACTYMDQEWWKEAEELQLQVKDASLRVLGEEQPITLLAIGHLTETYSNTGKWKDAEELHLQVSNACLQVLGEEHPDTLLAIGNLTATYRKQGHLGHG